MDHFLDEKNVPASKVPTSEDVKRLYGLTKVRLDENLDPYEIKDTLARFINLANAQYEQDGEPEVKYDGDDIPSMARRLSEFAEYLKSHECTEKLNLNETMGGEPSVATFQASMMSLIIGGQSFNNYYDKDTQMGIYNLAVRPFERWLSNDWIHEDIKKLFSRDPESETYSNASLFFKCVNQMSRISNNLDKLEDGDFFTYQSAADEYEPYDSEEANRKIVSSEEAPQGIEYDPTAAPKFNV